MEKKRCLLTVLLSTFAIGPLFAKDIVICGTVTDVHSENVLPAGPSSAAVPCSVSVRTGCSAADGDLYFAKTNVKGYYTLTASLPNNCTSDYLFIFKGKKQNLVIATVRVILPQSSAVDTLKQNLQLVTIDEAMPDSLPAEILADWKDQDGTDYADAIDKIKAAFPAIAVNITGSGEVGYKQACHWRRVARMKPYAADLENIMFMKHHNFGGIEIGYHDNTDATASDDVWVAKSAMCILKMKNYYSTYTHLITKTDAVVRDPCISFDGKKVLFALSGKSKGTGYKIYEVNIDDANTIRQLTNDDSLGTVVADFEPCYLQNGDIMFTSTRNLTSHGDGISTVTNMFVMNGEGKYLRQVGFDQAHTFYPVLMNDGTVLYSRWEFNDRELISSMGLFTMNPDGCRQTEYYGNQTSWPLTFIQARPIPGSDKVLAIAGGSHGPYAGELMIINRQVAVDGTKGITMIAPKRDTKPNAKKSDLAQGNVEFLFQNPCPLSENGFLVAWRKSESEKNYKLYWMDQDGNRELLAWADQSVSQPVLIKPRKVPGMPSVQVNYNDSEGTFTMRNVYYGEGMRGVAKGMAASLRVVAINYRMAGMGTAFGSTMGAAPSGSFAPAIFCPVSMYGGSWDAKEVLGEAQIYEDGSAAFKVPAKTPVYFQVIDTSGYCIATMRSWSTLMPGEKFACTGCHESKTEAPPSGGTPIAGTPQPLEKPLGIEGQPFDYVKMVQPVFDLKCVSCHKADHSSGFDLSGTLLTNSSMKKSLATSYSSLMKGIGAKDSNNAIHICTIFSKPEQQPPYSFGSSLSGIMTTGGMSGSHHDVQVTKTERGIVACWIDLCALYTGRYNSYLPASDSVRYAKLEEKRLKWATIEQRNIKTFLTDQKAGVFSKGHDILKPIAAVPGRCTMRYLPKQHTLILDRASRGIFVLVDLRGRVLFRRKIADRGSDNVSISLPPSLSRGLYAARFIGEGLTLQMMVSIIR